LPGLLSKHARRCYNRRRCGARFQHLASDRIHVCVLPTSGRLTSALSRGATFSEAARLQRRVRPRGLHGIVQRFRRDVGIVRLDHGIASMKNRWRWLASFKGAARGRRLRRAARLPADPGRADWFTRHDQTPPRLRRRREPLPGPTGDDWDATPLQHAILARQSGAVRLLLDRGADPNRVAGPNAPAPLLLAAGDTDPTFVTALRSAPANGNRALGRPAPTRLRSPAPQLQVPLAARPDL